MTVVLKEENRTDVFIHLLNEDLFQRFGSNNNVKFNPWDFLQSEADYLNKETEGKMMLPNWTRPITKEALHHNFFWYRNGAYSFKLSGEVTSDEARDVIAVCKWLMATKCKFIDMASSGNYSREIVQEYLSSAFEEDGCDINKVWELPQEGEIKNS